MPSKLIIAATTALALALGSSAAMAQDFSVGVGFGPYGGSYYGYDYAPSGYSYGWSGDIDDSGHYTRDYDNDGYYFYGGDDYADEPGNQ